MNKIAFIGPKSYYRAFKFLGFNCFESETEEETKKLIKELKEEYDLIFTTEDLISSGGLGVVVLPGIKKKSKREGLQKQVERALGDAVNIAD
jgi:vacuolar-type H+-ATPase subunit F/Vma7